MECCEKVHGKLALTERWRGFRPCKGKVVLVTVDRRHAYCRRHLVRFHEWMAAMNRGKEAV
jgi:hypothetical protein